MIADCSLVSPALRRNELLCLFALQQPILSISESINVYTLFIIVFCLYTQRRACSKRTRFLSGRTFKSDLILL